MVTNNETSNVKQYAQHEKDCGSSSVQIVRLTEKIQHLTEHCQINKKDNSAIRGLVAMVQNRRKLLNYLYKTEPQLYTRIVKEFNIRHRIAS